MRTTSPLTYRLALGIMALAASLTFAANAQPITSDSRIKTFVYNPNEVFGITTHYGYQSNIEFGPKEEIDTISVGDRVAWQIIPAGQRLFIRAMEENARTNMTIVTNFRAYQFDLRSSTADAVFGSEELTYVVRFFYPPQTLTDKETPTAASLAYNYAPPSAALSRATLPPSTTAPLAAPNTSSVTVTPLAPPAPTPVVKAPPASSPVSAAPITSSKVNYHYTFSGPSEIAPTKIYDDGKTTYFKLRSNQNPKISIVTAGGESVHVTSRRTPEGLLAVDAIAPRFSLSQASKQVIVYNEAGGEV